MATRSLGQLTLDLVARIGGFESGLDKAGRSAKKKTSEIEKGFKKLGIAVAGAAVAAATGVALLVKSSIDAADSLNDLSKSSGVSVESLSGLGYAAKLSGTDLDSLATGMKKLSSAAFDAAKGVKAPAESFKQLGIEVTKADGSLKSTEELLLDVAEVFSQYEDGIAKAAIAQDLFGKSGVTLIPFLNEGKAGIEALTDEARQLGLVISQDTATAADEFNDNLTRLSSAVGGLGSQLASDLLPSLVSVTDQIVEFVKSSGSVEVVSNAIEASFKLIVDIGSRVVETFTDIGSAFGAISAAVVQAAQGNFREAYDIIVQANADAAARDEEFTEFRRNLWEEAGKSIVETVQKTDAAVNKSMSFGGGKGSGIQEISITAGKLEISEIDRYYEQLDSLTKTSTERAVAAYEEQKAAIRELYRAGEISAEQYAERSKESLDALLPEFEVTAKKIKDKAEEVAKDTNSFFVAAAEGTQGLLADTIFDGLDGKVEDVEKTFIRMIDRIVSEALAANIATKLFGENFGKGETGGWIGAAAKFFGGLFGGGRANGGPVEAGMVYRVNETQDEYFKPSVSGKVIPLSKMSHAGGDVNQTIVVQGRVDARTANQLATKSAQRQRIATARLG